MSLLLLGPQPAYQPHHHISLHSGAAWDRHTRLDLFSEMKELPIEICRLILDFLSHKEWLTLRLVSRLWNGLCERLVWKRVLVGQRKGVRSPFNVTFGSFGVEDVEGGAMVLTHRQVWELASDEHVLRVASYTHELEVGHEFGYEHDELEASREGVYDAIGRMFSSVKRVKTNLYDYDYPYDNDYPHDNGHSAFQRVLDMWKPTVEFSLGVGTTSPKRTWGIFDVGGAKIKELFVEDFWLCGAEAFLPLSRTKDGAATPLGDLPTPATLSISIALVPRWQLRVPGAMRVLHIVARRIDSQNPLARLFIPSGLEELHIEEYRTAAAVSLFDFLDLSEASELRVLSYIRVGYLPSALARAVLEVKDSLECLAITCRHSYERSPRWSFNLGDLARGNLGLKHLVVPVEAIKARNVYGFDGEFPELESLWIDLAFHGQCCIPAKGDLLDGLITEILSGCPKLSRSGVKTFKSLKRPTFP